MAKFALTNVRFFAGGADLTANSNKAEMSFEVEEKDATAFSTSATLGTWHESLGGISTAQVNGSGQWDAADIPANIPMLPDDASFAFIGNAGQAVTICPQTASAGAVAYCGGFMRQNYTIGGSVGDVAPWSGTWQGSTIMGRGAVTVPPAAYTATGLGTGIQFLALGTADYLTATLHVLSLAGTTPSVSGVIQSAAANTFASPTTRATFTSMTAQGGQVVRFKGPTTDTWWRLSYTIAGTTPSIVFASALGVS
jgi:hypothetical protein